MAYRKFLLFLLAMVIVALAAMAGIYAFVEGAARTRQDMIIARGVELASFYQEWRMRPGMFGSGNGSLEGMDILKVNRLSGTGEWLEEDDTGYRVDPLRRRNHARLMAVDEQLNYQVVIHVDANSIIRTVFLDAGIIYIDQETD